MISDKLTLVDVEHNEDTCDTHYACDVKVTLAGDSIWDCELTDADEIRITDIYVSEGVVKDTDDYDGNEDCRHVAVYYTVNGDDEFEDSWRIYTDTGFEGAVSNLLGFAVNFTEQGMQEEIGRAHV